MSKFFRINNIYFAIKCRLLVSQDPRHVMETLLIILTLTLILKISTSKLFQQVHQRKIFLHQPKRTKTNISPLNKYLLIKSRILQKKFVLRECKSYYILKNAVKKVLRDSKCLRITLFLIWVLSSSKSMKLKVKMDNLLL